MLDNIEATPLLKGTTGVSYTEKVRVALASVEVVPPDLFDPLCDALDIPIARTSPVVRIIGKKVFGLNSE